MKLKFLERRLEMESINPFFRELSHKRLKPEEYTGGTFTISNLGMFESIEHFTAIVPHTPSSG